MINTALMTLRDGLGACCLGEALNPKFPPKATLLAPLGGLNYYFESLILEELRTKLGMGLLPPAEVLPSRGYSFLSVSSLRPPAHPLRQLGLTSPLGAPKLS